MKSRFPSEQLYSVAGVQSSRRPATIQPPLLPFIFRRKRIHSPIVSDTAAALAAPFLLVSFFSSFLPFLFSVS